METYEALSLLFQFGSLIVILLTLVVLMIVHISKRK